MSVANPEPRAALLQSVIDAIARDGLGARSLRDLARDAGTSHRMLIHHFGCYARGAHGGEPFERLLPALVEDWLAVFPPGRPRDQARLALAVIRGLLLDVVATEDRRGTGRAMKQFLELLHNATNR